MPVVLHNGIMRPEVVHRSRDKSVTSFPVQRLPTITVSAWRRRRNKTCALDRREITAGPPRRKLCVWSEW